MPIQNIYIIDNIGTIIQSLIGLLGIIAAGILIYNLSSRLDANVQLDRIKKESKNDVNKFLEIIAVINGDVNVHNEKKCDIDKVIFNKLKNLYNNIDPPNDYPISEMYVKVDTVLLFETSLEFYKHFKNTKIINYNSDHFLELNKLTETFIDKGVVLYLYQLKINTILQKHIPWLIFFILSDITLFIIIYYIIIFEHFNGIMFFGFWFDYLSMLKISNMLALTCLLYTAIIIIYLLKIYKK